MTETSPNPGGPGGRVDWATALAEHGRWLRAAVLVRLGERQAVDEVMQEVALAAVAQRAPLLEPGRVAAWLYRLAVRQSLLYRRRAGRRQKLARGYAARGAPPAEGDPLEWLVRAERGELVRAALGRLPRRDAEILLLKYGEDLSYRELARRLGLAESAVEARLHRARGRLRAELRGESEAEQV
jgi:RNA polymerase sigma-70 factor (ECF subfamily)